jgi:hypothetical protein
MSLWITQQGLPILSADDPTQATNGAFTRSSLVLGALSDGLLATGDAMDEAHAGFVSGLQSGATLLRVVGVAAIPATGGASLLLTAGSTAAAPFLNEGAEAIAGSPDGPPISSGEFETAITEDLRETLAVLLAQQRDLPAPEPGEYRDLLIDELGLDPVRNLDLDSSDEAGDHSPDEHWSSRQP